MTYKCLLFELKDGVATLTLNRPERLNALGDTLRDDLHDAIVKCSDNPEVRVIVHTLPLLSTAISSSSLSLTVPSRPGSSPAPFR